MMSEPVEVFSLAEYLGEEMQARGWQIEDAAARMGVCGPARDALHLALAMSAQVDDLKLSDDFFEGLARSFDVSAEYFRRLHQVWLANPKVRQPYEVPDSLFGPWLRAALSPSDPRPASSSSNLTE